MKKALLFCIVSCVLMYFYIADIGIWLSSYSGERIITTLLIIGVFLFVLYKLVNTRFMLKTQLPELDSCDGCGYLSKCDGSICIMEEE